MHAELDAAGRVRFAADSDSELTRGLAAVLVRALSGLTPAEVQQVPSRRSLLAPMLLVTVLGWANVVVIPAGIPGVCLLAWQHFSGSHLICVKSQKRNIHHCGSSSWLLSIW